MSKSAGVTNRKIEDSGPARAFMTSLVPPTRPPVPRCDRKLRPSSTRRASLPCQVTVLRSPLSVTLSGGDRTLSSSRPLALDATLSFDPDAPGLRSGGLNFTWLCIRGGARYGEGCGVAPLGAAGVYIFTVLASAWRGSRSASASVTITVLDADPPCVAIAGLGGNASKLSARSKLFLSGAIVDGRSQVRPP
jgi:hypothetical protein